MKRLDMSTFRSVLALLTVMVLGCAKVQKLSLDAETYFGQGYERFQKADYDRAISDFTKAVKVNPRYAKAYNYRGIAYMKSGNKERACSDWKRACELGNCNNYKVAKGRGDCK